MKTREMGAQLNAAKYHQAQPNADCQLLITER